MSVVYGTTANVAGNSKFSNRPVTFELNRDSRRPIRIQIEHRSFAGPYIKDEQIRKKNLKVEIHAMMVYKMKAVQVAETTLILTLSLLFSSKYRMAVVCPAFAAR